MLEADIWWLPPATTQLSAGPSGLRRGGWYPGAAKCDSQFDSQTERLGATETD